MRFQKDRFLKKVTVLSAISILLMSFAAISSMGTQTASGQANVSSCEKIPISKVGANGERGAETALLAVDNDIKTRWANDGKGSFIQLDLGKSEAICDIDVSWFIGHKRSYNFVISTSEDGKTFTDTASARSTGQTSSPERYNIPDQTARYVRVTVHGNSENDLGSINEMSVRGRVSAEQQTCTIPKITGISATGNDGHIPQNTLAKTIAETLQARLTGSEQTAISKKPTENPEAHELYLKGRFFWNKRTADDLRKSIDYFNQAIEKDPNYAQAYAGLAQSWKLLPAFNGGAPKDCFPQAEAAENNL